MQTRRIDVPASCAVRREEGNYFANRKSPAVMKECFRAVTSGAPHTEDYLLPFIREQRLTKAVLTAQPFCAQQQQAAHWRSRVRAPERSERRARPRPGVPTQYGPIDKFERLGPTPDHDG